MKFDPINSKEYEKNQKLQKMFANSQLCAESIREMTFLNQHNMVLKKQDFFLYEGKWRSTNPDFELARITFDENETRSLVLIF